jgi:hypothetical protein
MPFQFEWNEFADQPHNVAPRSERLKHHLKHAGSYFTLTAANLRKAIPVLKLYRRYWRGMYKNPVKLENCFGLSVSPPGERKNEVVENLKDVGVRLTLVRIPSWEKEKLPFYQKFCEFLHGQGFELAVALLQRREDILSPSSWQSFLEEVFSRLSPACSFFEIGHAWNRTKWGVWDFREYLDLALPAVPLAARHDVKLVGPAVIDFEFHLYPPLLDRIPFDKVSSLLYVDRQGAPENTQFGWSTARKIALLKAIVDKCSTKSRDCWITEFNWPLEGTGKYSPASGKPNVSEEEQANYLVRYFVICLTSGLIERIYWWQLVAPGYGLVDSRESVWRKRPSFMAFETMVKYLEGSIFIQKLSDEEGEIYLFQSRRGRFAVCWSKGTPTEYVFPWRVSHVLGRNGEELPAPAERVKIDGRPTYVFFD